MPDFWPVCVYGCVDGVGRVDAVDAAPSTRSHRGDAIATRGYGRAAVDATSVYDFNATLLHLMGLDHERLTFYHNGLERRLTNVHGHDVKEVLA